MNTLFQSAVNYFWSIFLLSCFGIMGCGRDASHVNMTIHGGTISFTTASLELTINGAMGIQIACLSPQGRMTLALPGVAHFLSSEGGSLREFIREPGVPEMKQIETPFGSATAYTCIGIGHTETRAPVQKTHTLIFPDAFPELILNEVAYRNLGTADIWVDAWNAEHYRLDARLDGQSQQSDALWSLQGGLEELDGGRYILPLQPGLARLNPLGTVAGSQGGGFPMVDVWSRYTGLAIGHVNQRHQAVSMPVSTDATGITTIEIHGDVGRALTAGEILAPPVTCTLLHSGDFFDPVALLARRRHEPPAPAETLFAPVWETAGSDPGMTPEDILGILPALHDLGIGWVFFNHPLMQSTGDRFSGFPGFPYGEADVLRVNQSLHDAGLRTRMLWHPFVVDPSQILPALHACLIQQPDGTLAGAPGGGALMCPSLKEVRDFTTNRLRDILQTWNFDGVLLPLNSTMPDCYNHAHGHVSPGESADLLADACRHILTTMQALKDSSTLALETGGFPPFHVFQGISSQVALTQTAALDQLRYQAKFMRAFAGAQTPVYTGAVEQWTNAGTLPANFSNVCASIIGAGGIPGTRRLWPAVAAPDTPIPAAAPADLTLEPYAFWFNLYNRLKPARGEYRNLYILGFDRPETHMFAQSDRFYYGLFAADWNGPAELRGLDSRIYFVLDYEHDVVLGTVRGPIGRLNVSFTDHLLLAVIPQ